MIVFIDLIIFQEKGLEICALVGQDLDQVVDAFIVKGVLSHAKDFKSTVGVRADLLK